MSSPAVIQIFGNITLRKLLLFGALPAASVVAKESIGAMVETRAAIRDFAFSHLLDLETKT